MLPRAWGVLCFFPTDVLGSTEAHLSACRRSAPCLVKLLTGAASPGALLSPILQPAKRPAKLAGALKSAQKQEALHARPCRLACGFGGGLRGVAGPVPAAGCRLALALGAVAASHRLGPLSSCLPHTIFVGYQTGHVSDDRALSSLNTRPVRVTRCSLLSSNKMAADGA